MNNLNRIKLFDPFVNLLFVNLFSNKRIFVVLFICINLATIIIAVQTKVWSGISYPLSQSYTAWVGDFILSVSNFFILGYYTKNRSNPLKFSSASLILMTCFSISAIFHYLFVIDQMHGWCEIDATSGLSPLGYLHLIYSSIQLYIFIVFAYSIGINLKSKSINSNQAVTIHYFLLTVSLYVSLLLFTSDVYTSEHTWAIAEFALIPILYISVLLYFNYILISQKLLSITKSIFIVGACFLLVITPTIIKSIL